MSKNRPVYGSPRPAEFRKEFKPRLSEGLCREIDECGVDDELVAEIVVQVSGKMDAIEITIRLLDGQSEEDIIETARLR